MTRSRRPPLIAGGAVALLVIGLIGWRLLQKPAESGDPPTPSALVTLAPVRTGPVDRIVTAYGVIEGSAAATRTVSASRDVIVQDLLIAPGLSVSAGAALIRLKDTPAGGLAYRQAVDAEVAADRDLARVQRLYDQQLAANDQLIAAHKTLADAQATVSAQTAVGGGGGRKGEVISSPITGIVSQVMVQRGQQVVAGTPLMTIVASDGFVAQFGVEPTQAALLAAGQAVRIASVLDPNLIIPSRITTVGRAVDPTSRLIQAAAPARSAGLALGAAVRGEITTGTLRGLTVPAASVIHDEKGAHVFVVRGGKAREIEVSVGLEQGDTVLVSGALAPGDQVATAGAYQLEDGMAARIANPQGADARGAEADTSIGKSPGE